jgi:hypothetical protein
VEDVAAHLDQTRDTADFTEPAGPGDEMAELYAAIMADPPR